MLKICIDVTELQMLLDQCSGLRRQSLRLWPLRAERLERTVCLMNCPYFRSRVDQQSMFLPVSAQVLQESLLADGGFAYVYALLCTNHSCCLQYVYTRSLPESFKEADGDAGARAHVLNTSTVLTDVTASSWCSPSLSEHPSYQLPCVQIAQMFA